MDQNKQIVHAFKGFNTDLTCRGFQFAEDETYTHYGPVVACHSGFHAVTQPIDVLRYYPPATSVYHAVELEDTVAEDGGADSKIAGRVIKIGARIELPALIKAQVDFVFANAKKPAKDGVSDETNGLARATKKSGAATASGYSGAATASGDQSVAIVTGRHGRARGKVGSWIVLTERDAERRILSVQAVAVDGETIREDVFYTLRDGKVVEA